MEALVHRVLLICCLLSCMGASSRTTNFVVTAQTKPLADEICRAAEQFRKDLAIEWLGRELPRWSKPCPIVARVNPELGAGGVTSFMFDRRRPFGWQMSVQGSRERVLDSVIPHEVTHTIFATHFGQPLPRWADEGACTAVEHISERSRHQKFLLRFLTNGQGIAFNRMFAMREYPPNMLPLYSQGYSVARYLIEMGGKQRFVAYIGEGLQTNNWTAATRNHYDVASLGDLQGDWLSWVKQGSPNLTRDGSSSTRLADARGRRPILDLTTPEPTGRSPVDDRRRELAKQTHETLASGSWYARQARGEHPDSADSAPRRPPIRSASRPQGMQRPDRILQWDPPPGRQLLQR